MALRLTVILLLALFAVMQFVGQDNTHSPFAETPGAAPENVILAVAPLETPASAPAPTPVQITAEPQVTRPTSEVAALPSTDPTVSQNARDREPADLDETPRVDTQSVLDLVVLDPNAALNTLNLEPRTEANEAIATTPAPEPTAALATDGETVSNNTGAAETATEATRQMAEVTGSAVNLRAGPSTGNSVLGRARVGDVVEWMSDPAPGWALVKHPDFDDEVYMSSQFLRRLPN